MLSVLDKHQVHSAFAIRNNVVNYKKVLLGVYRNGVTLSHDLRRLAAFFREPPPDLSGGAKDESHRGFFRPSRYRELSDALCTTDGAVGGVLDARRFCKAVCCVPRHPDASRSLPRPFGQPFAHYRCAGLLSEALPQAMKGWRLLQECKTACDALGASSEGKEGDGESGEGGDGGEGGGLGQRLNAILRASCETFRTTLPEEAPSGWDALLESLRSLCLPSDEEWFVRCALIARGGAKALAVAAESRRLSKAMEALLQACLACEEALASVGGADMPQVAWASEMQRRSDHATPETAKDEPSAPGAAASAEADAAAADDKSPSAWARRGHPAIRAWVVARKHVCTLGGLRVAVASTAHWLRVITEGNPSDRILFVGTDGDWQRGTTAFAPAGFDLPKAFEHARLLSETHSVAMVARLASHGWPAWIRDAAAAAGGGHPGGKGGGEGGGKAGGKAGSAAPRVASKRASQPCAHCSALFSSVWMRDSVCLGCEHRVRRELEGRCPFGGIGGRAQCTAAAWCPHDRRCLACDSWSCARCRFHQGDGSDVAGIVATLQPACLFVDFDRTLCSTRGGSPLKGNQSVDDDLVALCAQMAGRVHIVTRNAHVDDIRTFLAERGLPGVPIHRVSKAVSKAEIVCDKRWMQGGANGGEAAPRLAEATTNVAELGEGDDSFERGCVMGSEDSRSVLFVDDTLAEHLSPEIRNAPHVVRFLFARSS